MAKRDAPVVHVRELPTRRRAVLERADVIAGALVFLLGGPLVFMFASAFSDGETRRHETPLRALLGSEVFDDLMAGEEVSQHYLGNDRLAPDFELQDQHGETWRLSDHRGQVVVMNFWTSTCGPCIEEMPTLVDLARILEERDDIELVTIAVEHSFDDVARVVPPEGSLRVLLDPDRAVTRDRFGTRLFPETWVIDRRGVVRLRIDGPRDWAGGVALDAIRSFL